METTRPIRMFLLTSCDSIYDAKMLQNKLQLQGISSFLSNENFTSLYPNMNGAIGIGVQIFIDEEDQDEAIQLLGKPELISLFCPQCYATDVREVREKSMSSKIKNTVTQLLSAIFLRSTKRKYQCTNCGKEFTQ